MQLLTPLIRARIERIVLDAIQRLPPNIRPTDPRFLEWLESLIRYRTREPMGPPDPKPAVLGGIGIADKTVRHLVAELDLMMDSGLLAYDPTWLAANPEEFPLGIFLGEDDMEYVQFDTGGTSVPQGIPPKQFLIPTAKYHDERLDWPATPPVTTPAAGSNTYESPIITDAGEYPPGLDMVDPVHGETIKLHPAKYNGLMCLALQAKIGAGLDPKELLWELATEDSYSASSALVHSANYVFWKIAIESNGAKAQKLKNSIATDWIVDQMKASKLGVPGDVRYRRFMAWILMDLTVDATSSEITLLTESQLEHVYKNAADDSKQPLKHGWHYTHGAPWKGSIVTVVEMEQALSWWLECTLATITFSWAGDVPELSLEIEKEDEKAGLKPQKPLWIENRFGQLGVDAVVMQFGYGSPNEGDDTPVYCYYDENDDYQDVKWTAEEETPVDAEDTGIFYGCGELCPGGRTKVSAHTRKTGGWSVGEFDYGSSSGEGYRYHPDGTSWVSRDIRSEIGKVTSYTTDIPDTTQVAHSPCDCTSQAQVYPDLPPGYAEKQGDTEFGYGQLDIDRFNEFEWITEHGNFVIIPEDDAGAVIIGSSKTRTYALDERAYHWICTQPLTFQPQEHFWREPGGDWYDIGGLSKWHFYLHQNCPQSQISPGGSTYADPDSKTVIEYGQYNETLVHTVRAAGDPVDANQDYDGDGNAFHDDWAPARSASLIDPHEGWTATTNNAYTGAGHIYTEIPSSFKINGGYPTLDHDDLHASIRRWVGWA